ncbi:hypothetical protein SS05631_c18630 [Sinorhizobium sp. CCBAU 05631]|nr:hypothetical protein SS05631_c18630 [Sinorhizobium sp. CCBAU 05631]
MHNTCASPAFLVAFPSQKGVFIFDAAGAAGNTQAQSLGAK